MSARLFDLKERCDNTATLLEILILAVIQGIAEWLPISSSGHLVIAQEYLGLRLSVFFDVVLHLGSLFVVLAVFWRDVVKILKAFVHFDLRLEEGRLGLYIFLGAVATFIIGFVFKDLFESFFHSPLAVGVAFILTGSFYSLLYFFGRGERQSKPLDTLRATIIGVAQGVALIPGVSRSGSTIATGLLLKVDRRTAFRFSFLLFIPTVVGAMVATAVGAESLLVPDVSYVDMLLGLVVTVVVGYLSLRLLQRIVLVGRLHLFAFYCWVLGFVLVLVQILRL